MEERKLNFNAPLLSVRRFAMASSSFSVENDKKCPEDSIFQNESQFIFDQVTEPVAVPFHWEFIPGRSKNGRDEPEKTLPTQSYKTSITPKFLRNSREDVRRENPLGNERESEDFENHDGFSDVSETSSSSDSPSPYNFSVSGLSGSDGPDLKPSGTFSADPQTLAFMMARFLPAASAVAINTATYVSRKQLVELPGKPRNQNFKASMGLTNRLPELKINPQTDIRTLACVRSPTQNSKKFCEEHESGVGSQKLLESKSAVGDLIPRSRSSPFRHSNGASPFRIENLQSLKVPKANMLDLRENPEFPNAGKSNPAELPSSITHEQHEPESELLQCSKSRNEDNQKPREALDKLESDRPPLPKSPPESWLRLTLPSISSENLLGDRRQSKRHNPKISSTGTSKWETIVKTSNRRHDHLRYSEELVPRVSQHYKS